MMVADFFGVVVFVEVFGVFVEGVEVVVFDCVIHADDEGVSFSQDSVLVCLRRVFRFLGRS